MGVVIANSMSLGTLNAGRLRPKKPGEIDPPNQLTTEQAEQIAQANNITAEQASSLDGPELIQAIAASNLDGPDLIQAISASNLVGPELISALAASSISAPGLINAISAQQISSPNQLTVEQASQIQAARNISAIDAASLSAPNVINSIPDNTAPPYPLNHARILYDNKLSDASGSAAVLSPNTYEKAEGTTFIFTMPESRQIDSIAVLGVYAGLTVSFRSAREGESFVTLGNVEAKDNRPIMLLFNERQAERVAVVISSSAPLIHVSAGISLQMQRPIFGGHNPITMSRQTTYQSRRSESGNFVSRNIIRQGLSGNYEWSNLTDDWVREYLDPFILSARKLPFFIAWRPSDYPDEVAYAWTTGDISPSNIGTRNLMSAGMEVQAYGD